MDVGSGPGRFTPSIGSAKAARVAIDLSAEMLGEMARRWPSGLAPLPHRVRADALHAPLKPGRADAVVALGNPLGFAGPQWESALSSLVAITGPAGVLVLETAPAPGERSRYLRRLPTGAVGRLFAAPPGAVLPRIRRDGFDPEPARHTTGPGFERISERSLDRALRANGMTLLEAVAVAPALGADPERAAAVHAQPRSWARLLAVEEELGHDPERRLRAAALLVAASRQTPSARPPTSGER